MRSDVSYNYFLAIKYLKSVTSVEPMYAHATKNLVYFCMVHPVYKRLLYRSASLSGLLAAIQRAPGNGF